MELKDRKRFRPRNIVAPVPIRKLWNTPRYQNQYRHIPDEVLRFAYQDEDNLDEPDYLALLAKLGFTELPWVAMAIPARDSGTHIEGLLDSLYGIQYPRLIFAICIEEGDPTEKAIEAYFENHPGVDRNKLILAHVKHIANFYGRNANRIRNALARMLSGLPLEPDDIEFVLEHFVRPITIPDLSRRIVDIICWTDTKIRHPRNLVAKAVYLMLTMFNATPSVDYSTFPACVTGVMKAMPDQKDASAQYQDKGALKRGQNAPWDGEMLTWRSQFFRQRWPVTAIWFETVYFAHLRGLFHPNFRDSYEDYEAVIEALQRRLTIAAVGKLIVYHKHRTDSEAMSKQNFRSGLGYGQLLVVHPSSPFTLIRFLVVIGICIVTFGSLLVEALLILLNQHHLALILVGVAAMIVFGLGFLNAYTSKSLKGFFYLRFTFSSIFVYVFGFIVKLSQGGKVPKSNRWLQTSSFIPPFLP